MEGLIMGLKKLCSKCNKVIKYGTTRCNECEAKHNEQKKSDYKYYDLNIRGKDTHDFYNSPAWKKVKKAIRVRDNGGMCVMCMKENRIKFADLVHHIDPIKDNYDKRLSYSNLICLCNKHHKQVHAVYDTNEANKSIMQKKLVNMIKTSKEEF